MVTSKLQALIKQAYKGRNMMDAGCSGIFNMIEEIIDIRDTGDLHVFIQDGDGLVLCWDRNNTPVSEIFAYHGLLGRKLNEKDLKSISI